VQQVKKTKNGKAYIINNGSYLLAMISLGGWDDLDFVATENLNPVSQKSSLISAKANTAEEKIFITLQLWKKGKTDFTSKEVHPVKRIKIAQDKNSVEVVFQDGSAKTVNFN